uniref:Uncharacterized protein n=1 Tax=Anguilla anguilla TaxID=7936 RepID=A0A0E9U8H4_ANGAN
MQDHGMQAISHPGAF